MKKHYKELREKLGKKFEHKSHEVGYVTSNHEWLWYYGIKMTRTHLDILYEINNKRITIATDHEYRKAIVKYLKKHKFKEFKNAHRD